MKTFSARTVLLFTLFDGGFGPLAVLAYIVLLGPANTGDAIGLMLGLMVIKLAVSAWYIKRILVPYELYSAAKSNEEKARLVADADASLQEFPRRFALHFALSWVILDGAVYAAMRIFGLEHFALAEHAAVAVAFLMAASACGCFAGAFPIAILATAEPAGKCAEFARQHGAALRRHPVTLQMRIGSMALATALAPLLWLIAVGYMAQVDDRAEQTRMEASLAVTDAAVANEEGSLAAWVAGARGDELRLVLAPGQEIALSNRTPSVFEETMLARLGHAAQTGPRPTLYDRPRSRAAAMRRLEDGRVAVAVTVTPASAGTGFLMGAGVFGLLIIFWAPLNAVTLARAVSRPLEKLTETVRKMVDEGNQSQIGTIPVLRNDEVGTLSDRFNDLLDMMRDLGLAADSIARGDLRVRINRQGELPDAFRKMVGSLQDMVSQLQQTSVELAGAASEIFAASQEHEAAATSQSSAMTEISHTMDSLSESAAHVSEAVQGVLSNAEQTLVTTDTMVERIEGLSGHTSRISDLLDTIRDIADRSDLLALNGSLEASRAGEGGQGFALVAAEMRRLAERVTAAVQDVKKLVTDIRESSASTIMATEESRKLAGGTTEAARQITFVSQQQRTGTEQVSQSVREITEMVTQVTAATSQTRTSAQDLKHQADRLAELVKQFEVRAEVL